MLLSKLNQTSSEMDEIPPPSGNLTPDGSTCFSL